VKNSIQFEFLFTFNLSIFCQNLIVPPLNLETKLSRLNSRFVPKAEAVGITVYKSIEERSNSKVNNEYCTGIDFLKVDLAF
jgi:hypothetical protein